MERGDFFEVTDRVRVAGSVGEGEFVRASVEVALGDVTIKTQVPVRKGVTSLRQLLPVLRGFSEAITHAAVEKAKGEGKGVSCRAGCAACCRQLVPVAEAEALAIGELVEGMAEPRRSEVRGRFLEGKRRLEEAGLLERVREIAKEGEKGLEGLALEYFALGIGCPFLEGERCSIYAERPLVCREYVVANDPGECAKPGEGGIVAITARRAMSDALMEVGEEGAVEGRRFVALILAMEWAEGQPAREGRETGAEVLTRVLGQLTGKGKGRNHSK